MSSASSPKPRFSEATSDLGVPLLTDWDMGQSSDTTWGNWRTHYSASALQEQLQSLEIEECIFKMTHPWLLGYGLRKLWPRRGRAKKIDHCPLTSSKKEKKWSGCNCSRTSAQNATKISHFPGTLLIHEEGCGLQPWIKPDREDLFWHQDKVSLPWWMMEHRRKICTR